MSCHQNISKGVKHLQSMGYFIDFGKGSYIGQGDSRERRWRRYLVGEPKMEKDKKRTTSPASVRPHSGPH